MSEGEELFVHQCKVLCLHPEREFKFHPNRKWRFDFAFHDVKLAVEIEGGVWTQGRHLRGKGFEADCIKYAEAALLGWTVLRFSTGQVISGEAIGYVEEIINGRADQGRCEQDGDNDSGGKP